MPFNGPTSGLPAKDNGPGGVGPVLGGYGSEGDAWPLRLYEEYEGLGLTRADGSTLTLFLLGTACKGGVGSCG